MGFHWGRKLSHSYSGICVIYIYLKYRLHIMVFLCSSPQAWYDTSRSSAVRSWTRDVQSTDPWRANASPILEIPGARDPWGIRSDPAHTFAIQGFGSSTATSSVLLLARMDFVPGRSTNRKLESLYDLFTDWCRAHGKTTSLDGFSLLKFKMQTLLA